MRNNAGGRLQLKAQTGTQKEFGGKKSSSNVVYAKRALVQVSCLSRSHPVSWPVIQLMQILPMLFASKMITAWFQAFSQSAATTSSSSKACRS
jgi:hypothetical protein